jgi:hypothetical protein
MERRVLFNRGRNEVTTAPSRGGSGLLYDGGVYIAERLGGRELVVMLVLLCLIHWRKW